MTLSNLIRHITTEVGELVTDREDGEGQYQDR